MQKCSNAGNEELQSFLLDPGIPGVRSMGPSLSKTPFWNLTDVTLADEDTNSIPTEENKLKNLRKKTSF